MAERCERNKNCIFSVQDNSGEIKFSLSGHAVARNFSEVFLAAPARLHSVCGFLTCILACLGILKQRTTLLRNPSLYHGFVGFEILLLVFFYFLCFQMLTRLEPSIFSNGVLYAVCTVLYAVCNSVSAVRCQRQGQLLLSWWSVRHVWKSNRHLYLLLPVRLPWRWKTKLR